MKFLKIFMLMTLVVSCANDRGITPEVVTTTTLDQNNCTVLTGETHFINIGSEEGLVICLDSRDECELGTCNYAAHKTIEHPTDSDKKLILERNANLFTQYWKAESEPITADVDSDGDGVLDDEDLCATEIGSIENNGCPWTEADLDSMCMTLAGIVKADISDLALSYLKTDASGALVCKIDAPQDASLIDLGFLESETVEESIDTKTFLISSIAKDSNLEDVEINGEFFKIAKEKKDEVVKLGKALFIVKDEDFQDDLEKVVLTFRSQRIELILDQNTIEVTKSGQKDMSERVSISYVSKTDAEYGCKTVTNIDEMTSILVDENSSFEFTYKDTSDVNITNVYSIECKKRASALPGKVTFSLKDEDFSGDLVSVALTLESGVSLLPLSSSNQKIELEGAIGSSGKISSIDIVTRDFKKLACSSVLDIDKGIASDLSTGVKGGKYSFTYKDVSSSDVTNEHQLVCGDKTLRGEVSFDFFGSDFSKAVTSIDISVEIEQLNLVLRIDANNPTQTLTNILSRSGKILSITPSGANSEIKCNKILNVDTQEEFTINKTLGSGGRFLFSYKDTTSPLVTNRFSIKCE